RRRRPALRHAPWRGRRRSEAVRSIRLSGRGRREYLCRPSRPPVRRPHTLPLRPAWAGSAGCTTVTRGASLSTTAFVSDAPENVPLSRRNALQPARLFHFHIEVDRVEIEAGRSARQSRRRRGRNNPPRATARLFAADSTAAASERLAAVPCETPALSKPRCNHGAQNRGQPEKAGRERGGAGADQLGRACPFDADVVASAVGWR